MWINHENNGYLHFVLLSSWHILTLLGPVCQDNISRLRDATSDHVQDHRHSCWSYSYADGRNCQNCWATAEPAGHSSRKHSVVGTFSSQQLSHSKHLLADTWFSAGTPARYLHPARHLAPVIGFSFSNVMTAS